MITKPILILGGRAPALVHCIGRVSRSLHSGNFNIQPFVKKALDSGRPIVALESTIITHGMPYPQNLSVAREVEDIVRTNGAVPAVIGILKGSIHVGLQNEELEFLAKSDKAVKVSRRDLPYVLSQGLSGGTTVAATMIVAHKAGIPVFVTGGIGGVHREGEKTMDVSADLTELGRTPVAVISAGVKSILDIGRTLEYLETQGVCVAAFGQSREFPAFFFHQSGFQAPCQVQNEEEAAKLIDIALIKNNAKVGSRIAVALSKIQRAQGRRDGFSPEETVSAGPRPVVIGGINVDFLAKARDATIVNMGGVLQLEGRNTATYCVVITGHGELVLGLGDMDIHQQITEQYVSKFKEHLRLAPLVCIDGNVPVSTIQYVCQIAQEYHLAVFYEPTDVDKASKPFFSDSWRALACTSPNLQELRAIVQTLGYPVPADLPSKPEDIIKTAMTLVCPLLRQLHCAVITLGQHGVLTAAEGLCAIHYPAIPVPMEEIVNVSGAGDSLMAGIVAGLLAGEDTDSCVRMGLLAANLSLRSYEPVSPEISAASVSMVQVKSRNWPEPKTWRLPPS
ncbi:hypothetical protein lerEdw1_018242 [Lerista edwardsae]|nr:hypothetical protein lerEdw1_018242 [Lerista edwardsae]